MGYDDYISRLPDYGNGSGDPIKAFREGLRFALRHGDERAYLDRYRHVAMFAPLVVQAEADLPHAAECECQICVGAVSRSA